MLTRITIDGNVNQQIQEWTLHETSWQNWKQHRSHQSIKIQRMRKWTRQGNSNPNSFTRWIHSQTPWNASSTSLECVKYFLLIIIKNGNHDTLRLAPIGGSTLHQKNRENFGFSYEILLKLKKMLVITRSTTDLAKSMEIDPHYDTKWPKPCFTHFP